MGSNWLKIETERERETELKRKKGGDRETKRIGSAFYTLRFNLYFPHRF